MTEHVDQRLTEEVVSEPNTAPVPVVGGSPEVPGPEPAARAPVALRWLTTGSFALGVLAMLLAWGRHDGSAPYPAGQWLMVLAGLGLLPGGLWLLSLDADRTAGWRPSGRAQGLGVVSVALAFLGGA